MAIRDWFIPGARPSPLPPEQRDARTPVPKIRRRRRKTPLEKALERTPEDREDERGALERLAKWKTRANRAEKLRTDWEREFEVERCEKYFLGKQWDRGIKQADLVLNRYLATIKTIKPNLMFQMPKYFVRPRSSLRAPVGELRAAMAEGMLEFIGGQDQNLKRSARLAVLQAFFRLGVLKTIYDPRLEPNPRAGEPMVETDEEGVPLKDDVGNPLPRINPLTGDQLIEPEEVLTDEFYRYDYVDARHLLLPDEGPDPQKWTWIGEQVQVPLAKAKDDPRFPQRLREQFEANSAPASTERGTFAHLKTLQEDETFRYTEVYDLDAKRCLIWADGQRFEEFLLDEPLQPGLEDHPYAVLVLGDPITGPEPWPWPIPFTYPWLEPQREYNISRQQIIEGGKRSGRKLVYDDATFPDAEEAVKFLQDPADMGAAKITDIARPPLVLTTPDVNPAIYKNIALTEIDWRLITGQTGARIGDPDADTATEAGFVERAANIRDADLQDLVSDWMAEAGRKMLQLVQGTLTLGLWVKMRGFSDKEFLRYAERYLGIPADQLTMLLKQIPGLKDLLMARFGEERWQPVTREQLTFEAEVTVQPGSSRPRNLDVERRNWLEFLKIIGQFPQIALSRELLRETASKFEHLNERMLDELVALAEKMVQIQSKVAGREQGGAVNGGGAGSATAGNPDLAALLAGVQNRFGGGA